ncbi:MAG: hypothetical protein JO301_02130 [Chitinophagaceae bacterium]|nr:hypothetical protein [Chitinophagaceae bacterium]
MLLTSSAQAQNTSPEITVRELTKGKVQVSWTNPYETCIQLAVQRSTDSVNNFRTIFSSLSPELPSNGYVDPRPLRGVRTYYRIFYVLLGGAYYFSKAVPIEVKWENPVITPAPSSRTKPAPRIELTSIYLKGTELFKLGAGEYAHFRDSINHKTKDNLKRMNANAVEWIPAPVKKEDKLISIYRRESLLLQLTEGAYQRFKDSIAAKTKDTLYMIDPYRIQLRPFAVTPAFISVYRNDSLIQELDPGLYRRFRDSIAMNTRDTLFSINSYRIEVHPFAPKYAWRASNFVYTNAKGYVTIMVPLVKQHHYRVVFYDEDNSEIFQIRAVKEAELVLDKTNFVHAGWFSFELFEDDKLKERNKFYLSRD